MLLVHCLPCLIISSMDEKYFNLDLSSCQIYPAFCVFLKFTVYRMWDDNLINGTIYLKESASLACRKSM